MPWVENSLESTVGYYYGASGNYRIFVDSLNYTATLTLAIPAYGESVSTVSKTYGEGKGRYEVRRYIRCDSIFDTKEFDGIIYEDVIYVYRTTQLYYHYVSGGQKSIYEYYYAKNIGLIKITSDGYPAVHYKRYLNDYYIAE